MAIVLSSRPPSHRHHARVSGHTPRPRDHYIPRARTSTGATQRSSATSIRAIAVSASATSAANVPDQNDPAAHKEIGDVGLAVTWQAVPACRAWLLAAQTAVRSRGCQLLPDHPRHQAMHADTGAIHVEGQQRRPGQPPPRSPWVPLRMASCPAPNGCSAHSGQQGASDPGVMADRVFVSGSASQAETQAQTGGS